MITYKKDKNIIGKRVMVAMSGGVDSSVAAALLKKQGYDVVGVFMRFWVEPRALRDEVVDGLDDEARNTCCSVGAEAAARAVAAKLKIPLYVFHFAKEFKKAVVDYFLADERLGRTPNPCVVCNNKIKFGLMFERAIGLGADFLATGHYARKAVIASGTERSEVKRGNPVDDSNNMGLPQRQITALQSGNLSPRNDNHRLFCAQDKNKDQSYFLYTLTQEQLGRILFPLGDYLKSEVYEMAKKWQLPYRRNESFDLCFVANDRETFIKRYLKLQPGKIVAVSGGKAYKEIEVAQHQGLPFYTIGQRKNIPIGQGPWWVVKKDEKRNILYVSNNEEDLYSSDLLVDEPYWISGNRPKMPLKVLAKIRYKSEAAEAVIDRRSVRARHDILAVQFKKPQRAITPGQSAVFYGKKGELLGGGVIEV